MTVAASLYRSRRTGPRLSAQALAAAFALAAAPAFADVLVTRDGSSIVTAGPFEVEGRLVVFRLEDGSLGSLRLSDVDLDASRQATEEALRPEVAPAAVAPPDRRAVTVITDRDVRPAQPTATGETPARDEGNSVLRVTEWNQEDLADGTGTVLVGRIENTGPDVMGSVRIVADLFDDEGSSFASHEALVRNPTLMPGQSAEFRVNLPDLFAFTGVRFTTTGLPLAVTSPEKDDGEETAADGGSGAS